MTKRKKVRTGRPRHEPTAETRLKVYDARLVGTTQEDIALMLRIDSKTLREYYRYELDTALPEANKNVGGTAYLMATGGGGKDGWRHANPQMVKYWLGARAGWKEAPTGLEFSGPNGGPIQTQDVSARELIISELARLASRADPKGGSGETE